MSKRSTVVPAMVGAILLLVIGPTFAADIIWVDEGAAEGFDGWRDLLEEAGHTVERMSDMGTLDDAKIDAMNGADLVIVSRDTNSGSYDDGDEPTQWNSLTIPLIQTSSYLIRSNRWQWVDDTATPALTTTDLMVIVEDHPIFGGVGSVGDEIAMMNTTTNLTGATDGGNGQVLATHTDGRLWITLWEEAGTPFYGATSQAPAAARMWFAAGEGINGATKGAMNLTEEGQAVFLNAVAYLTGGTDRVKAYRPTPSDGGMIEQTLVMLSWRAGDFAAAHEVYLGTDPQVVAAATADDADVFLGRVGTELLTAGMAGSPYPDALVPGETYYWRVDEVNDIEPNSPWTGDVWSFQVEPAIAWNPFPVNGMKHIDPDQDLAWEAGMGTLFHTIYFGETFEEVDGAVAGGWMTVENVYDPGPLELDKTYYWRVDEFKGMTTDRGEVWSFTTRGEGGGVEAEYFAGMALAGDPVLTQIEPSINHNWSGEVVAGLEDQVSARWRGNLEAPFTETVTLITTSDDGVRLWVDGRLVIDNWTNHGATDNQVKIDMAAGQVHIIVMEWYEDGGGAVAQLSWQSDTLPRQIIPQGWLQLPLKATGPSPAHLTPDADQNSILSWIAGDDPTGHQVYFGDDAEAVANADPSTAGIYRGQQAADVTTYNPGPLEWAKTYYWRVDEVNPDGVLQGAVWCFTTADFIWVDDFETYTNEVGNRVFQTWIDGLGFSEPAPGNPGNGSAAYVGHDIWAVDTTYTEIVETKIVQNGAQSMPLYCNNSQSPYYSETDRTFAPAVNWDVGGVTDLSIWVQGESGNAPGQLYVALSSGGAPVVVNGPADAVLSTDWIEWRVPLADFASVNRGSVRQMIIGVGDRNAPTPGGDGLVFIDNIRVVKPEPTE